jgi:hypothetical protein
LYTVPYPPNWWLIMTTTITTSEIAQLSSGTMRLILLLSLFTHMGGVVFASTKVLVVKVKNNTTKKISSIRKQMFAF